MALMCNWPTFLSAMSRWDLSNTIGHPVAITESHAKPWADLTGPGPYDSALRQQEFSRAERIHTFGIPIDTPEAATASTNKIHTASTGPITPIDDLYTDAHGKSSPWPVDTDLFDTRGGLVLDRLSGVKSREQQSIHQEVEEATQLDVLHSRFHMEPPNWLEVHLFDAPSSDAHMENLGEGTWEPLEGQLQSPGYYSELTNVLSQIPSIKGDPPSWLDLLRADDSNGGLHNDGFPSKSSYDSITGLRSHSEVHNDYTHDPLSFFNIPHIPFSRSLSGNHIPAEHALEAPDNNFAPMLRHSERVDTSFDSQMVNTEPKPISRSAPSQDPSSPTISSVANGRQPLEALGHAFNHLAYGLPRGTEPISHISEAKVSDSSTNSHYSSIGTEIHTSDSPTPPNGKPLRLQSNPSATSLLSSKRNFNSKLKPHGNEGRISHDPVLDHQTKIKAIQKYYGKAWYREILKKKALLDNSEDNLGQEFLSNPDHQPISPRELIDSTYQPKILEFINSFSQDRIHELDSPFLKENMGIALDNYLEILTICSEVVWSLGLNTKMEDDVRDGYEWIMDELARLPQRQSEGSTNDGDRHPSETPIPDTNDFAKTFDSLSVYDGTVFWLSYRVLERKRERVGAKYVLEFMCQKRSHWIKYLTPHTANKLYVKTLLMLSKRIYFHFISHVCYGTVPESYCEII
ncbi:uncharacterized protein MELLADRAFT_68238 [Melampsora larici-populina 98AG31]|uniref:Uncharacterized protein n=1 Tax=Melampsora larici-populina (strain 98AG31 / pathotype 3-4-7) TaxID=747676 RepID=F4S628_MELLP|nr:uncharacterized protein MELLADRAFT_68238 [Melampsora larici-populina 98AG31]EGF99862.1 hypothetical protein MELLADRAFT_68238 [Melampsora larici-populina 98AG31]